MTEEQEQTRPLERVLIGTNGTYTLTPFPGGGMLFETVPPKEGRIWATVKGEEDTVKVYEGDALELLRPFGKLEELRERALTPEGKANLPDIGAAFLQGLTRLVVNNPAGVVSGVLRSGWNRNLAPERVEEFLSRLGAVPWAFLMLYVHGLNNVGEGARALPDKVRLPEWDERAKNHALAIWERKGELFDPTPERIQELEKVTAEELLKTNAEGYVQSYWELSEWEYFVDELLLEVYAGTDYKAADVRLTPGEILRRIEKAASPDNYKALDEAVTRLSTIYRPRAYSYRKKRGKKGKAEMRAATSFNPLWSVQKEHALKNEEARVVSYVFAPAAGRFHQVNKENEGDPAFYRVERSGLLQHLEKETGNARTALEARILLRILKNNLPFLREGGREEEPLVFTYDAIRKDWTFPTKAKKVYPPKDEREAELRPKVEELHAKGNKDREVAEALGLEVKEAKRLRERAGLSLRTQSGELRTPQLKKKLEAALTTLKNQPDSIVIAWELPKGDRFRVRCRVR